MKTNNKVQAQANNQAFTLEIATQAMKKARKAQAQAINQAHLNLLHAIAGTQTSAQAQAINQAIRHARTKSMQKALAIKKHLQQVLKVNNFGTLEIINEYVLHNNIYVQMDIESIVQKDEISFNTFNEYLLHTFNFNNVCEVFDKQKSVVDTFNFACMLVKTFHKYNIPNSQMFALWYMQVCVEYYQFNKCYNKANKLALDNAQMLFDCKREIDITNTCIEYCQAVKRVLRGKLRTQAIKDNVPAQQAIKHTIELYEQHIVLLKEKHKLFVECVNLLTNIECSHTSDTDIHTLEFIHNAIISIECVNRLRVYHKSRKQNKKQFVEFAHAKFDTLTTNDCKLVFDYYNTQFENESAQFTAFYQLAKHIVVNNCKRYIRQTKKRTSEKLLAIDEIRNNQSYNNIEQLFASTQSSELSHYIISVIKQLTATQQMFVNECLIDGKTLSMFASENNMKLHACVMMKARTFAKMQKIINTQLLESINALNKRDKFVFMLYMNNTLQAHINKLIANDIVECECTSKIEIARLIEYAKTHYNKHFKKQITEIKKELSQSTSACIVNCLLYPTTQLKQCA